MCVTLATGSRSGAGDIASADVATAKTKATLINNLIIVSSHMRAPLSARYGGTYEWGTGA